MAIIYFKRIQSCFMIGFFLMALQACSGLAGGKTPSSEIPAPVSHLSISSPDSSGLVRVTASAGFADGGSTVTVTNTSATSLHVPFDFLIRNAVAQTSVTVTANADGSFEATLAAHADDKITITYAKEGQEIAVADEVPANVPPLPAEEGLTYRDVTYNPTTNEAIVVANDGTDGFLVFFNLSTQASNTATVAGLSGANRIDLDTTTQIAVIADEDDSNNVTHYHIPTGNTVQDGTGGHQVTDVATSPSGNYAVIAFEASSPSFAYYDIVNDVVAVDGDATDSSQNMQRRAHWAAIDTEGQSEITSIVSEAGDGTYFLSTHLINTSLPSFTQQTATALIDLGSPGGLAFFDEATQALVTDRSNDRVALVIPATGAVTRIEVEDDPRGIAVNSAGTKAYVVNGGERTLSVIDLADLSVQRVAPLGLSPTMVAMDPTGSVETVIVLNTGDNTLTLFEP